MTTRRQVVNLLFVTPEASRFEQLSMLIVDHDTIYTSKTPQNYEFDETTKGTFKNLLKLNQHNGRRVANQKRSDRRVADQHALPALELQERAVFGSRSRTSSTS